MEKYKLDLSDFPRGELANLIEELLDIDVIDFEFYAKTLPGFWRSKSYFKFAFDFWDWFTGEGIFEIYSFPNKDKVMFYAEFIFDSEVSLKMSGILNKVSFEKIKQYIDKYGKKEPGE